MALGQHPHETLNEMNGDRRRRLDSLLADWHEKQPDTLVETQVLSGAPSQVLVNSTRTADLVVLGGRRHPDGAGMRLGGLAHTVLHHAHCPVMIAPES